MTVASAVTSMLSDVLQGLKTEPIKHSAFFTSHICFMTIILCVLCVGYKYCAEMTDDCVSCSA